jgi:DNA invertase Pin-like site-specific DNA recombinase
VPERGAYAVLRSGHSVVLSANITTSNTTMNKATAIYLRVSSKSQDLRSQEGDLKRWADVNVPDAKWYRDRATGTKMERPAMDRLLADVEAGKINRILVWRLDRLGRTAAGLTKLFADLQARKVGLLSLRDSLDLSTASGRLMAHVLASVAAYETEVRRERQTAGIEAAKAAGVRWGGSEKGRLLTVTKEQVATVKRLHKQEEKIAVIARSVGLSRPTVYRLLAT